MALQKKKTSTGAKARQRDDDEDRSLVYRDWRREVVGKGKKRSTCYTCDLDQVEYVIVKQEIHPVAIIELTRYDQDEYAGSSQSWAKYRSAVLDRYFFRDSQGRFVKKMAELIGVPAYLVLFRKDVESFWIFDMCCKDALWVKKDADEYREWLCEMKTKAIERIKSEQDISKTEEN